MTDINATKLLAAAPAILEASSEAIATLDSSGRIMGANSRFHLLLNASPQQCEELNIRSLFREMDFDVQGQGGQAIYEPARLTKPDGTSTWVLIKFIVVGKPGSGYQTILIQDPEAIRRIIDRLDYIENYDIASGLANHRKGLVEFEQLQASNLSGGCFLVRFGESEVEGEMDVPWAKRLKALSHYFAFLGDNQVACRYSASELLFVYSSDSLLSRDSCVKLIKAIGDDAVFSAEPLWLAFQEWKGTVRSATGIISHLRANLISLSDPQLLDGWFDEAKISQGDFLATLEQALASDQLEFYIQPQINSEIRQVVSGELLIRWVQEPGKIIYPSQFVDFLEEGAFADRFLSWSIQQAVEILLRIRQETGNWFTLALNVGPKQLSEALLVEPLLAIFAVHEIPTEYLEIEITERITESSKKVLGVLRRLQQEGFKVAIDDFGTGYSSLSYLRQFPLDRLKIDRVFISNLENNEEDRLIATAIASLAHVLGLEVVAEGVEERGQASFLRDIGCEYFQGFLIGKPMPVSDFIRFCTDHNREISWIDTDEEPGQDHRIDSVNRLINWKKSFATDIASIDQEHRDLIDILNRFTEAYLFDPASVNILETLELIAAETIKHFDHEERVMRNIGYPRFEIHKEKHKWLIADISKRKVEVSSDPENSDFDELLKYLKYWLLRHIVSEDTHLHRFINKTTSERRIH